MAFFEVVVRNRFTLFLRPRVNVATARMSHTKPSQIIGHASSTPFITLPHVPNEIDILDIRNIKSSSQLLVFTEKETAQIKELLQSAPDGKYSKKHFFQPRGLDLKFSIIKYDQQFYAVYHGVKSQKECGVGTLGVAKYAQNIETGKWIVAKFQSETPNFTPAFLSEINKHEYFILKQINAAIGTFERTSPTKGFQTVLLMDLVHGRTIANYVSYLKYHQREVSLSLALNIAINLCKQLNVLHNTYHWAHKDLHHGNVMYDASENKVELIDYGRSTEFVGNHEAYFDTDTFDAGYMMATIFKQNERSYKDTATTELRKAMIKYALSMTTREDGASIPTVAEAKEFYMAKLKEMPEQSLSHFYINVDEMIKHKDKNTMYAQLKKSDIIHLGDRKERHPLEYLVLKRELEMRHGIFTTNKVMIAAATPDTTATDLAPGSGCSTNRR